MLLCEASFVWGVFKISSDVSRVGSLLLLSYIPSCRHAVVPLPADTWVPSSWDSNE